MPKLVVMVPETNESVTRPVIFGIVRDLAKLTGIDPKAKIFFPGEVDSAPQVGSVIGDDQEKPHFSYNSKVTLQVEEDFDQDRILSTAVFQPENRFIFRDDAIETYLKPAYATADVVVNFVYRGADRQTVERWRNEMKTKVSMGNKEHLHLLKYHYLIPEELMVVLKELHRMREAVAPYGQNFDQYWRATASERVTQVTNSSGARQVWGMACSQARVLGWFDFDSAPEKIERTDEGSAWSISFRYHFKYDKPIGVIMGYPLVVHNQLVASNFRPSKEDLPERPELHPSSYTLSSQAFSAFESGRWQKRNLIASAPGYAIPSFDEFIPHGVVDRTLRLLTMLTTVETDPTKDPLLLCDLNDLGDGYSLDPKVLQYMAKVHQWMHAPHGSPFVVSLYRNRDLLSPTHVTVDADLKVRSTIPLDLRSYYHVRVGLHTDWRSINSAALDILREDGDLMEAIMRAVDDRVRVCKLSTGWVPTTCLTRALDQLDAAELAGGNGQNYQFNTVMSLFIAAQRTGT